MISAVVSAAASRAGLAAIGLVAGFLYGHHVAGRGATVRDLRSEVATLRIDLAIAKGAAEIVAAETADLDRLHADLKGKNDAYAADLAKRPDDRCRLTGADVRRVHGNR